jgi:2-polyprenyl-3-methyl-5-hydroxy-6-metoxy-1,4-benzoquinol methylase
MDSKTIEYYAQNAGEIAARYESAINGMATHFARAFAECNRILDIGCGSGRDMAYLHLLGKTVYGIDATAELVEHAQVLHPELRDLIICTAIPSEAIPFGGGFDGILCSAVLMHIPLVHQRNAVCFRKACLIPGGRLLYSVPSKREDVISDSQRDITGRLFIADCKDRLQQLFEENGFVLLEEWINSDSIGRGDVEWASFLMKRDVS